MTTYIYAVVHAGHPVTVEGSTGVGAPPAALREVRSDDLVAVVSDAPEGLRAKRRDLEAHQRVVESVASAGTALPMRFGTVAPDDEAVRTALADRAERYRELLGTVDGAAEFNLKAADREEAMLRELLIRDPDLRELNEALRARGGGSHNDRLAFGGRVAAAVDTWRSANAERILAELRPHAVRTRVGPAVDGCAANISFLVATNARDGFEESVRRLRGDLSAHTELAVYGPLPPYSFVD